MADAADRYVLALDQGTSGTAALVFDREGSPVGFADREHHQSYPQPGWVEHDPVEIFEHTLAVAVDALAAAGISGRQIAAVGITNQRETTLIWERATGRPIAPAIVWQDRRTAPLCQELRRAGLEPLIREQTGLLIDAYFSGTKVQWLLENVPDARRRAEAGELAFGTVDSWLLWNLTDGAVHATDPSNAGRTMLFDIHERAWDDVLLRALNVPPALLPEVRPSSGRFGELAGRAREALGGAAIPITGVAGDQQSALFGQACFAPGMSKNTYGTGSFLLMNTGTEPKPSAHRLLTTVAGRVDRVTEYALEGAIFVTGAAVQWLRDGLGIIADAADVEALAASVPDSGGVLFVPALAGLGSPHWDQEARGTVLGLTRGTTAAHIARATLDAIAFQTRDAL